MWQNLKWLRITPDSLGRGGTKTGIHSFQQLPINDVRDLSGGHIYRGYWRRDYDSTEPSPTTFDTQGLSCLAIHGYTFPSLTDPAAYPTIKVLTQNVRAGGVSVVWDMTAGAVRQSRPGTNQAGTFINIGGRCVFGDGGGEALLMDDRTPAIHAQANQPFGIDSPKQPMTLLGGTGYTAMGTCYSFNGSGFLTHPDPNHPIGTIKAGDTVRPDLINGNYVLQFGALMADWAVVVDGESSNTTNFGNTGTIAITTGTSLVTLTGATWPATFGGCGLSINFNGYSFVVAAHGPVTAYDINGVARALSNTQLLILGVYDGPTISGVTYSLTGCRVTMGATSSLQVGNTNSALTPPDLALGYSQNTASFLVQIGVLVEQANGFYRNMGRISLGPAGGGVPDTTTDTAIGSGFTQLYSPSGPWVSTDVGKTIIIDHAGDAAGTTMLVANIAAVTGEGMNCSLTAPNQNLGFLNNVRSWWVLAPVGTNDAAIGIGTPGLTSASNPWTVADQGKEIIIAGAGAGGDALFTKIKTFVNAGSVTLDTNAAATVTGVQAYWGGTISNTHNGPTYAYAWYDPETGHMSNISPLVTVPRPITQGAYPDFANITPCFQIDPGAMAYPSTTDAIRFSHVMFFRTLSTGGSTLYPIGSLQPFVGKVHPGSASTRGSWNPGTFRGWMGLPNNYTDAPPTHFTNIGFSNAWYDFSSDADLLLSGGFRAPQYTNDKPMVLLRGGATEVGKPYAMAYWDRRLWIVNTQEPNKIAYSCDEAQCPLGLPEESYPPTNFLRLPSASDGKVRGMRAVGDVLLITTQRFAYIVAGNNESNYRLMKVSSSMPGVGTYQMDEFPTFTGAEGEPTTIFFLGTDRVVYQWTMGGAVVPISQPIQDQLDALIKASPWDLSVQLHSLCLCMGTTPCGGSALHPDSDWNRWAQDVHLRRRPSGLVHIHSKWGQCTIGTVGRCGSYDDGLWGAGCSCR